jgi:HAD superfamily hydrolase (TIGR01509 family)
MDGVLVDSESFAIEAAGRVLAEHGLHTDTAEFRPFIGTGEGHLLGGVAEKHGLAIDEEKAKARLYAIYLELIPGRLQALPGVFSFVQECHRRGLRLALASSADTVKVEANLHAIGLPRETFAVIVTGSEVKRKKPAPDIFLAAAERLGLPPALCIVVEDAVAGVAAAKAAGARCLALTTSFPAERLTAADWVVPDLAHVPAEVFAARRAPC